MEKTQLTLELVTPMFLNAARSSGPPVLRAAPFRGVLRYWLRALAQSHFEDPISIEKLKEIETAVFGSTKIGSFLSLDVSALPGNALKNQPSINMLPHRVTLNENPLPTPGFVAGGKILLGIRGRIGLPLPEDGLKALLLWLNLGGVGKRARRGFGSLQCIGVNAEANLPEGISTYFWTKAPNGKGELSQRIFSILNYCLDGKGGSIQSCNTSTALPQASGFSKGKYPAFGKSQWIVVVGEEFDDYTGLMTDFFVHRLNGNRGNAAFGSAKPRFASPVHLHIAKSNAGFLPVITAFYADPSDEDDWNLIYSFMADCLDSYKGVAFYSV
jgi:hypothetical protein